MEERGELLESGIFDGMNSCVVMLCIVENVNINLVQKSVTRY